MAAKAGGIGANFIVASLFAAVFIANWLSVKYWSYPFVWCAGQWALQPIVQPWLFVTHFMALAYFVMSAWTLEPFKVAKGLMVVVGVFGMPTFLEILFRLGKTCG